MARIEARIEDLGLTLPEPLQPPPGIVFPFTWVRVCGNRAYVSGHIAQNPDGSIARPLGKVGTDVSPEEGYHPARLVALAHLGSLKRALGDLDLCLTVHRRVQRQHHPDRRASVHSSFRPV